MINQWIELIVQTMAISLVQALVTGFFLAGVFTARFTDFFTDFFAVFFANSSPSCRTSQGPAYML